MVPVSKVTLWNIANVHHIRNACRKWKLAQLCFPSLSLIAWDRFLLCGLPVPLASCGSSGLWVGWDQASSQENITCAKAAFEYIKTYRNNMSNRIPFVLSHILNMREREKEMFCVTDRGLKWRLKSHNRQLHFGIMFLQL